MPRWEKQLSRTDAQQDTAGYRVPYLRFTRSNSPHNTQTWFRNTFFAGANWHAGFFGEHPVEEAQVDFHVTIAGQNCGTRTMMVTHDSSRENNNNTPNTWLHYDDTTRTELEATDYSGHTVIVERQNDAYDLTIV